MLEVPTATSPSGKRKKNRRTITIELRRVFRDDKQQHEVDDNTSGSDSDSHCSDGKDEGYNKKLKGRKCLYRSGYSSIERKVVPIPSNYEQLQIQFAVTFPNHNVSFCNLHMSATSQNSGPLSLHRPQSNSSSQTTSLIQATSDCAKGRRNTNST